MNEDVVKAFRQLLILERYNRDILARHHLLPIQPLPDGALPNYGYRGQEGALPVYEEDPNKSS